MRLGIIVGAVTLAASQPAWAGDALCLWSSFPADPRAVVIASYAAGGADAVTRGLTVLGPPPGLAQCVSTPGEEAARAAASALQGFALERAASLYIQQTLAIAPEDLEAAWRAIPPADLAAAFSADAPQPARQRAADAIVGAAVSAGWNASAAGENLPVQLGHFVTYVTGRTLRDIYEKQF